MTARDLVPLAPSVAVPPDALLASSLHSARSRSKASLCMSRLASTVGSPPPYEAHPLIHKATMPTAISLVITRLLLVNYTRGERSIDLFAGSRCDVEEVVAHAVQVQGLLTIEMVDHRHLILVLGVHRKALRAAVDLLSTETAQVPAVLDVRHAAQ